VQDAVFTGEVVWQLEFDNIHWDAIKIILALMDVPSERLVLIGWQQWPSLFIKSLARWQIPPNPFAIFPVVPLSLQATKCAASYLQ
jgi:hypothetical protein